MAELTIDPSSNGGVDAINVAQTMGIPVKLTEGNGTFGAIWFGKSGEPDSAASVINNDVVLNQDVCTQIMTTQTGDITIALEIDGNFVYKGGTTLKDMKEPVAIPYPYHDRALIAPGNHKIRFAIGNKEWANEASMINPTWVTFSPFYNFTIVA